MELRLLITFQRGSKVDYPLVLDLFACLPNLLHLNEDVLPDHGVFLQVFNLLSDVIELLRFSFRAPLPASPRLLIRGGYNEILKTELKRHLLKQTGVISHKEGVCVNS